MENSLNIYNFSVDHAKKFGLEEAIMIFNLKFWIEKNAANRVNIHNNNVWTYNSARAFSELFPFWSRHKISRVLESLEKQNVLVTGNFNKSGYDRTKWYAFAEPASFCKFATSILQICNMHFADSQNPFRESATPIPDSKPNSKPNNKPVIKKVVAKKMPPIKNGILHQAIIKKYDEYVKKRTGVSAKITVADAVAVKKIKIYLLQQCADNPEIALSSWGLILDNLKFCEKFFSNNFQLTALNKNLVQIIDQIKNATNHSNNTAQQQRSNALDAFEF